uniref:Caffeoylshikimate esterase n=1 Tax=Hirondellea gigas TaxID=1518452 RepID=A0A6A7G919_9CRUS
MAELLSDHTPLMTKREKLLVTQSFSSIKWSTNKSLILAYILWLPPFGLFGFHNFYLNRKEQGFAFLFTGGLLGIGWIIDFFRLPSLLTTANIVLATNTGAQRREVAEALPYLVDPPRGSEISYANVVERKELWENGRGLQLFTHCWLPKEEEPKAIIFQCVGYAYYNSWLPSLFARKLASNGFAVYGIDYEGQGLSDGLNGYIPNFDTLISDCDRYFGQIALKYPNLKKFLLGESMGGAVALLLHFRDKDRKTEATSDESKQDETYSVRYDGAVLLAPMVKISDRVRPPAFVVNILVHLAKFIPKSPITPSKDLTELCFHDQQIVAEERENPLLYKLKPRLASALSLLNASTFCEENFEKVEFPFLVLHGEEDQVTEPSVSQTLYEKASSGDKGIKLYPEQWHALLFEPKAEEVSADIIEWFEAQTSTKD